MPMNAKTEHVIELPDKVTAAYKDYTFTIKGPKGELTRHFRHPKIQIEVGKADIKVISVLPKKKDYALTGTWAAHIRNMTKGVTEGFEYTMKMVYSHFPMKTAVKGDKFVVENFIGERHPRVANILENVKVNVSGDQVVVTGIDLEKVAQTAANIEKATEIRNYDPRIFQDGIYLVDRRK